MNFDPAVVAQEALARAYSHDDLGDAQPEIEEAEETFSSETGLEAKRAYETLIVIGEKLPQAKAFQEFLIFTTWQQVTEETISTPFSQGRTTHGTIPCPLRFSNSRNRQLRANRRDSTVF